MRIAKNASFIIEKVKKELDLNIIVIEGSEEARLSFLGASSSLPDENELIAVDIGGGSTEIIYGKNNIIQFKHSFQTGVVSLSEKYLFEFPYSKNALKEVNEFLSDTFTLAEKHVPKGIPTIAVAGTPTTLSCIKQNLKQYDEILVERSFLDSNDFDSLSNILENLDGKSIKEQFGEVVYGREDVLFSGLLILNYLKNLFNLNKIIVSGRGLRYGNIIDYMNNFKL
jgi:exopolyphosphatase/guanosine-5'-triphosphate,3'-diphosphate pyrophosphatase